MPTPRFTVLATLASIALAVGILAILGADHARRQAEGEIRIRVANQLGMRSDAIHKRLERLERSSLFLSITPPIQGLARADRNGDFDARDRSTASMWRDRLAEIFQGYIATDPEILEIRLIGVADSGREIVRVLRRDGQVLRIPDDQLRRRGARPFFKATVGLPPGRVYISGPVPQGDSIGRPLGSAPMLRGSTPIRGPDGRLFGILVVNLDARPTLAEFREHLPERFEAFLIDPDGVFLSHPDSSRGFGAPAPVRWDDDFRHALPDSFTRIDRRGREGSLLLSAGRIPLDPMDRSRAWRVAVGASPSLIESRARQGRNLILASSLGLLLAGGIAWNLHRRGTRKAEQARRAQARLGAIVRGSLDAIVAVGPDGRIRSWNHSAERLFGHPEEEAVGRPLRELLPAGEEADRLAREAADTARGRFAPPSVYRLTGPDARPISVSATASPIPGSEASSLEGVALILRDVTESEHDKTRILELNAGLEEQVNDRTRRIEAVSALWRGVLDHAGSAIVATGINGTIRVFNPAAAQMLGWSEPEMLELATPAAFLDLAELGGGEDFATVAAALVRDGAASREATCRRRDGSHLTVLLGVNALRDGEGRCMGYICVAQDLTERRRIEEELRTRTGEALAAGRAKSDFLANMSHEIRTPLNAVLGLAHLLQRRPLDEDSAALVRRIHRAGSLLRSILQDVLDLSKIDSERFELEQAPFRLEDVLDNVGTIMAAGAGEKDLELVIAPSPPGYSHLVGDSHRLEQVLVNLVGNAVKFTASGCVQVGIEALEAPAGRRQLRFSVRDTGIGIPAESIPHLFDAFTQADTSTSRRFGGTGLGLSIAKLLTERMGGAITVESEVGRGSVFRFEAEFGEAPGDESYPAGILDLLVADDSDIARAALASVAGSIGWRSRTVDSGEEALRITLERAAEGVPFDVVLLDWKMPGLDGLETARVLRERLDSERPPVVLVATAHSLEELERSPNRNLVDGLLSKPVTASSLHDAVTDALRERRGRPAAPQVATNRRLEGMRLLVVDDNETNREVVTLICLEEGAELRTACDGADALRLLAEDHAFDVVLMDVQMPVMSGYDAVRAIRATPLLARLPVAALTAGAFEDDQTAAREAGMDAFIPKPFQVEHLIATLLSLARSRSGDDLRPTTMPPSSAPDLAGIQVLDAERALTLWRSTVVLQERLEGFFATYGSADQEVSACLERGEDDQAAFVLHRLRGSASTLGLDRIAAACIDLERTLREDTPGDPERLGNALRESRQAMEAFGRSLGP